MKKVTVIQYNKWVNHAILQYTYYNILIQCCIGMSSHLEAEKKPSW